MTHPWIGADENELPLKELSAPVAVEPPLSGVDGVDCHGCNPPDDGWTVYEDDLWRVRSLHEDMTFPGTAMLTSVRHARSIAELTPEETATYGAMCARITRVLLDRPAGPVGYGDGRVGRVHMHMWGDGGEHFHVWFFPRPHGYLDLRGSFLVEWEELLPPATEQELRAGAEDLRQRLGR